MRLKDHEHPTLRRRFGVVIEAMFLLGSFQAIWASVVTVLVSALLKASAAT